MTARAADPSLGVDVPRLPRQRPHDRPVPSQSRRSGPQERRFRLDTVSLRGVFNQQIHGSKRSLRSVEDFTEFEQRTAYFNGDPIHAMKKGMQDPRPRPGQPHGPDAEHVRLPAGPEARTSLGRLDPAKASESGDARREAVLRQGAVCRLPSGAVLPRQPDARPAHGAVPRTSRGDGPIKTFTLRGIKESPPYLHDGRCLTLEDTVEFFNLMLETRMTQGRERPTWWRSCG